MISVRRFAFSLLATERIPLLLKTWSIRKVCLVAAVLAAASSAVGQAPDLTSMDIVLKGVPEGSVAIVKGTAIPANEFKDLYIGELARWQHLNRGKAIDDSIRIRIALNSLRLLIEREVLYNAAQERKLAIGEEELEKAWTQQIDQMKKALSQNQEEPLSEEEVLARAGATRQEALAELRKALLIEAMREKLVSEKGVDISEQEVKDWYEQNKSKLQRPGVCHLKDIFFEVPRRRSTKRRDIYDQATEKAENALQRIRAGQSFEAVARDVSEAPNKEQGGDLGTMPIDSLPEKLAAQVRTMQPGEVSDVLEGDYGLHIVKLVEYAPGGETSFEKAAPEIERILRLEKANELTRQFCADATADPMAVQVFLQIEKQLVDRPDLLKQFFAPLKSQEQD